MDNITKKLIQAYYEKNGSFDRIQNSITGAELPKNDLQEYLYSALGYSGGDTGKTSKQIHDLRQAYIRDDIEMAKMIDASLDTRERLKDFLKQTNNVPVIFETANVNPPENIKKYVNILADFYRNSDMLIKTNDGLSVLSVHLASLKYTKCGIKSEMQKLLKNNPSMKMEVIKGKSVYVLGKKIVVDKKLSEKQVNDIHLFALCRAVLGSVIIPLKIVTKPSIYFTAGILDIVTYLHLLDNAEAAGKTYNEMLSDFNIFMPDYEKLYKATGSLFVTIGDTVTAILDRKNDKIVQMDVNDFNIFLREGC